MNVTTMNYVLFLCSGNYYRSRFAEHFSIGWPRAVGCAGMPIPVGWLLVMLATSGRSHVMP